MSAAALVRNRVKRENLSLAFLSYFLSLEFRPRLEFLAAVGCCECYYGRPCVWDSLNRNPEPPRDYPIIPDSNRIRIARNGERIRSHLILGLLEANARAKSDLGLAPKHWKSPVNGANQASPSGPDYGPDCTSTGQAQISSAD